MDMQHHIAFYVDKNLEALEIQDTLPAHLYTIIQEHIGGGDLTFLETGDLSHVDGEDEEPIWFLYCEFERDGVEMSVDITLEGDLRDALLQYVSDKTGYGLNNLDIAWWCIGG